MPMRPLLPLALAPLCLFALPAGAATTYQIKASNFVSAGMPSCTVEVWAEYEPDLYAFAGAEFDLIATPDAAGGFGDLQRVLDGPGTSAGWGAPGNDTVLEVVAGQIKQLPNEPHVDLNDPVLIWRGTWSTDDFTPRTIELRTWSRHFQAYVADTFEAVNAMGPLVEGTGQIQVGLCSADCSGDGVANLFDFLCFTNNFNAQDPAADCDDNGIHDLFDFLCFMNVFNEGC